MPAGRRIADERTKQCEVVSVGEALRRIHDQWPSQGLHPDLQHPEKLTLRGMAAVKLYYCFYGRNAWHSTWAQRYSDDCMHTSFQSAKNFAERNRVQGSVFCIEELPALLIDAGDYPLIVTQINETCPLREYSCKARRREPVGNRDKIAGHRDNYLCRGAPINGVMLSFAYDSRFWRVQQPKKDSVILLYYQEQVSPPPLKTTRLKAWRSKSFGPDYYLAWNPFKCRVRQSSVLRVYRQSEFNQENANHAHMDSSRK